VAKNEALNLEKDFDYWLCGPVMEGMQSHGALIENATNGWLSRRIANRDKAHTKIASILETKARC
jgi:hypothetical protein